MAKIKSKIRYVCSLSFHDAPPELLKSQSLREKIVINMFLDDAMNNAYRPVIVKTKLNRSIKTYNGNRK